MRSPATEPATLPPWPAAMSTITLPGFMLATSAAVISLGAGRPGMSAVVMMMSTSRGLLGVDLGGPPVVGLARGLGVAVGRLLCSSTSTVRYSPPIDLHLVGDLGSRVGRPDDRAEARGRADRGESGDAGARDEHLGRRYLAGGGDLPGEEPAELVGGLDDRAVARDVRHRAQHVHRLGARDARHRVHRERGDAAGRERFAAVRA